MVLLSAAMSDGAPTIPDLGALYREARECITALVSEDVDASDVPATPEWTVHDVVAHLSGIVEDGAQRQRRRCRDRSVDRCAGRAVAATSRSRSSWRSGRQAHRSSRRSCRRPPAHRRAGRCSTCTRTSATSEERSVSRVVTARPSRHGRSPTWPHGSSEEPRRTGSRRCGSRRIRATTSGPPTHRRSCASTATSSSARSSAGVRRIRCGRGTGTSTPSRTSAHPGLRPRDTALVD